MLVSLKLPAVADKRRFGGQGEHFRLLGYPVVVHALRVFSVTHEAADVDTAFNFVFVSDHADNRNRLTRPLLLFQHLVAVRLHPLDLADVYVTGANRGKAHSLHLRGFGRVSVGGHAARIQV